MSGYLKNELLDEYAIPSRSHTKSTTKQKGPKKSQYDLVLMLIFLPSPLPLTSRFDKSPTMSLIRSSKLKIYFNDKFTNTWACFRSLALNVV